MAKASRGSSSGIAPRAVLGAIVISLVSTSAAAAETASIDDLVSAVVRINTHINPEGRTVQGLGREREGSGILIDSDGLVLTIGYLMVEAYAAEVGANNGRTMPANVVGYDQESGFGLLRAIAPLKLKPMPLGKSAEIKEGDPVLIASFGGRGMVAGAYVVAKREFAGSWEYLLDEALFTAPPHPAWSGAALISREGKLMGVGSLIVGGSDKVPGNMFVPIDRLSPILGDLIATGRMVGPARPWLGINTDEMGGRLFVSRVTPASPAERAGIKRGDVIVSVKGEQPKSLADFYRKVWAQGSAGDTVALDVLQDSEVRRIEVKSMNRLDHLKLKSTF
ncbi:MAG: serine protease [Alphaproteobacteria bacterium]|nr:MAG: serine protease [Alphaproteobacteria bacterium]TMJ95936.1 MAG: serine protease [Alphaproteobacteria bacterium]TMJ98787.1 MAG: serine protease [Alphaproteobacteria bacterium]